MGKASLRRADGAKHGLTIIAAVEHVIPCTRKLKTQRPGHAARKREGEQGASPRNPEFWGKESTCSALTPWTLDSYLLGLLSSDFVPRPDPDPRAVLPFSLHPTMLKPLRNLAV